MAQVHLTFYLPGGKFLPVEADERENMFAVLGRQDLLKYILTEDLKIREKDNPFISIDALSKLLFGDRPKSFEIVSRQDAEHESITELDHGEWDQG